MPSPCCDSCKDTCGEGAKCGDACTCGDQCKCATATAEENCGCTKKSSNAATDN
ncbi:hypothetical protein CBL_01274 [Carabus blaptoides fortunei]